MLCMSSKAVAVAGVTECDGPGGMKSPMFHAVRGKEGGREGGRVGKYEGKEMGCGVCSFIAVLLTCCIGTCTLNVNVHIM